MSEQLGALILWIIVLIPFGVFVRQIQQVRRGARSKAKGAVMFFCFSLIPISIYIFMFLALIGIEEVTKSAVIGEGLARTFALVVGIGMSEVILLTVVFGISVWFLRPSKS